MTAKEFVDEINNGVVYDPIFTAYDDINVEGSKKVATLDYDEHRWYVLGTIVFEIDGEYFGVRGPVILKSESMSPEDVGIKCEAFLMKEVPSVTYERYG